MKLKAALVAALVLSGGCRKAAERPQDPTVANRVASREITLFFESADLLLAPEKRTVPLPERESAALATVMRELLKGSANASVPKLFPQDVTVRGVYALPDGTAIVDIGSATAGTTWSPGSHGEMMAIYSVVQTLTSNFKTVQRVRFLVNGELAETFAGHIRLDRPLRAIPTLVSTTATPAAINTAPIRMAPPPELEGEERPVPTAASRSAAKKTAPVAAAPATATAQ